MHDIPVSTITLQGVIALATVIQKGWKDPACPGNCDCNPVCGCESHDGCCQNKCPCHHDGHPGDITDLVTNPIFRDVVQGLDINRIRSINDFQAIVGEIRTKMRSAQTPE